MHCIFLLHFHFTVKPLFWWQLLKTTVTIGFLLFVFPPRHSINHLVFSLVYLFFLIYSWNFILIIERRDLYWKGSWNPFSPNTTLCEWKKKRVLERLWNLPSPFPFWSNYNGCWNLPSTFSARCTLSTWNAGLTEAISGHSTKGPHRHLLFHQPCFNSEISFMYVLICFLTARSLPHHPPIPLYKLCEPPHNLTMCLP